MFSTRCNCPALYRHEVRITEFGSTRVDFTVVRIPVPEFTRVWIPMLDFSTMRFVVVEVIMVEFVLVEFVVVRTTSLRTSIVEYPLVDYTVMETSLVQSTVMVPVGEL